MKLDPQTIKNLLDAGGDIKLPYKSKVGEWYEQALLTNPTHCSGYAVMTPNDGLQEYDTFEEAWARFSPLFNNIGLLQFRVMEAHPEVDGTMSDEDAAEAIEKILETNRKDFMITIED